MLRFSLAAMSLLATCVGAGAQYYGYPSPAPRDPVTDFFTPQPLPPGRPYRGIYPNPYYGGVDPYPNGRPFGAPAKYCQKLCIQDFAPCDPPEYKRADGRCTNPSYRF